MSGLPSWLDLLIRRGQAPVMAGPPDQQPQTPFVPQRMAIAPVFARAPQMAQDVAAGIADPLLKAGNYLGGIMQGSQQFSWPETIQHGAALAMAMAPGPKGERIAGGIERGLAGAAESAAPAGIRAYHGSPYDFPAFDISKIGTGEGAQAYGHGLYFAENEATAKAYRDALKGKVANQDRNEMLRVLAQQMSEYEIPGKYRQYTDPRGYELAKQYDDLMASRAADQGKMYEVNIKAQPEQFLEHGKPLSEQSPYVQNALQKAGITPQAQDLGSFGGQPVAGAPRYADTPEAMQALHAAGIPGIKYLDQGSRGAGSGTSNYVVFNDKLIDILRKYGLAGMLGAGSAAPIFAPQGQQQ